MTSVAVPKSTSTPATNAIVRQSFIDSVSAFLEFQYGLARSRQKVDLGLAVFKPDGGPERDAGQQRHGLHLATRQDPVHVLDVDGNGLEIGPFLTEII